MKINFCYVLEFSNRWKINCIFVVGTPANIMTQNTFRIGGFNYVCGIPVPLVLLGLFVQSRTASISFLISVRLSVRMYQLGSHWTDFRKILILETFIKICLESPNFLKSDKNFRYFTWRAEFILLLPVTNSSENNVLWKLSTAIILTVSHSSTTHVTHCYVSVTTVATRTPHHAGQ
jgi:hypothetical protein